MSSGLFIAVEGVIGVGKTTLAAALAEATGARQVLEEVEENPFLPSFYKDRRRWAFQTQLFFLLSRYRQMLRLRQRELFQNAVVSDYLFQKDRIFANVNLSDKELRLYDTLFPLLERDVPAPDLVVYLQASTPNLLRRIESRGRSFESDMSRDYLAALNEAYNYFFFHFDAAPVLLVDSNALDLDTHPEQGKDLLDRIEEHPGGTVYYRPLGAEEE